MNKILAGHPATLRKGGLPSSFF